MRKLHTYTIEELQRLTGIDRRTIAYYTQEDLLPRVGRLGPRTRYPDLFLDRLRFIVRVRELEEAGDLPTRRLRDIRQAFKTLTDEEVRRIATGESDPHEVRELLAHPFIGSAEPLDSDSPEQRAGAKLYAFPGNKESESTKPEPAGADARMRSAATRKRNLLKAAQSRRSGSKTTGKSGKDPARDRSMVSAAIEVGELLARLDAQAEKPRSDKSRSEKWLRVPINKNVVLSVRNLDERHAGPAEQLVGWLKRLLVAARRKRD